MTSATVLIILILAIGSSTPDCILPAHPLNGRHEPLELDCPANHSWPKGCEGLPGTSVPEEWLLFVRCDPDFVLADKAHQDIPTVCVNGTWSPKMPSCNRELPKDDHPCILPAQLKKGKYELLEFECSLSNKAAPPPPGSAVPSGCVLKFSCDSDYQVTGQQQLVISDCNNSVWSPHPNDIKCERNNSIVNTDSSISKPTSTNCQLPPHSENRLFCPFHCEQCTPSPHSSCHLAPGSRVSFGALRVVCAQGYGLQDHQNFSASVCINNLWIPHIPQCIKQCPPLESDSLYIQCRHRGIQIDCNRPMLASSTAVYQCRPSHTEYPGLSAAGLYRRTPVCKRDGKWSHTLPECQPACGVSKGNLNITTTIVDGQNTKLGAFPWHVGIYRMGDDEDGENIWTNICGGSLISNQLVLTAAHCVEVSKASDLRVGLGKYYRSWVYDELYAVKRNVSSIRIPREYNGAVTSYAWDIALLLLDKKVIVNSFIMPVCRDLQAMFDITKRNATGFVVGWGKTKANGNESETLLYNDLSIIGHANCLRQLPRILAFDKFCGSKGSVSIAEKGDSGGGVTVIFNGLHYIFGIVSLKYNGLSVFTNVSWATHNTWIENEINHINSIIVS